MNLRSACKAVGVMLLAAVFVAGCASAPSQEMTEARQALQAAQEAGAVTHVPQSFKGAQDLLARAEAALQDGDYDKARADAVASKRAAVSARNIALAIAAAEAALAEAAEHGIQWRDSAELIEQARAAAAKGDEARAVMLANRAREQGEDALNRFYREEARLMLAEAGRFEDRMTAAQRARYQDAMAAVKAADGRRAYDLASALLAGLDTSAAVADSYQVIRGDSLWGISGRPAIYENPYYWPLIFKANTDRIRDADLIHPGQDLHIPRDYGKAEAGRAVEHARNRGAWSLGPVEASDRTYLAR